MGGALLPSGLWGADQYEELRKELTPLKAITGYNNFYEFSTKKEEVAPLSQGFRTSPWSVKVGGHVGKPGTFDIDDIRKRFPQEERVYRLRCVEGWSMVIPWTGFPLAALLKVVEPTPKAKYVRFETLQDWKQMPGQKSSWYSVALRRRVAFGRSDERFGNPGHRTLWQPAAPSERSSDKTRSSLEVRIQEHQIHREDRSGRIDAKFSLDASRSE